MWRNTFVKIFWMQELWIIFLQKKTKKNFKTVVYKARLLLKSFGCDEKYLSKNLSGKQIFIQTFWMQSKPCFHLLRCKARLLFRHFVLKARLLFFHYGCKARLLFKCLCFLSKAVVQKFWMQRKTFVLKIWGAKKNFWSNVLDA